jgi:hypothetical protein
MCAWSEARVKAGMLGWVDKGCVGRNDWGAEAGLEGREMGGKEERGMERSIRRVRVLPSEDVGEASRSREEGIWKARILFVSLCPPYRVHSGDRALANPNGKETNGSDETHCPVILNLRPR